MVAIRAKDVVLRDVLPRRRAICRFHMLDEFQQRLVDVEGRLVQSVYPN